jgi:hypothetical protein
MSTQTKNFMELCLGASTSTVKLALRNVRQSVIRELGQHYGCGEDINQISKYLSLGVK